MKISYGLRAFGIYFLILGSLIWFTLENAIERLNDGMRQSAESVLVDTAHVLSALIEQELEHTLESKKNVDENDGALNSSNTKILEQVFTQVRQRKIIAQIYQVTKTTIDSQVYVTNNKGVVIYDSAGVATGENFSQWRDVRLTLDGEYGARTSFIDQQHTEPDDPKAMVIAAPIHYANNIIGVVSVLKPINSLEGHLFTESKQLQRYAFALLAMALLIGFLLSLWFTHSLNKVAIYANSMAEGRHLDPPVLRDHRLNELASAISNMRTQLDGKEYVENYIHSLTHELKTPITGIQGAVELMAEDMSPPDRAKFIGNIKTSNQRMARLVERMLSLAKLEGRTELVAVEEFDLVATINRLVEERSAIIHSQNLELSLPDDASALCKGDRVLISQAIANLLDNAISFCDHQGQVSIKIEQNDQQIGVLLFNQGAAIPEFALDKLFDRFFSLPRPEHSATVPGGKTKSTGLGLSFVKEIMKLHHGKVDIENVTGGVLATLRWSS